MKVKVDNFINGDTPILKGSTKDNPKLATIKKVELVAAEDLGYDSDTDRYQLTVEIDGDELMWTPNKTSLKAIIAVHGDESDNWIEKSVGIFLVDQNVSGKMKKIAYAEVK